jgi:predicted porin
MNKKLIAIAVAAGLAPMAAQADVSVYGKLNMGLSVADSGGTGDTASFMGITSHDSRLGVKGSEDLGNGMSAFFKMETEIDMDNAAGNATFKRDKYLGIKGGFGEIKMGQFNTAYKNTYGKMDIFADSIGDVTGTGTHGELDDRFENMLGYKGTFGPITVDVNMDFAETDTSGEDDGLAVGLTYKAGSIMVTAGMVNHDSDQFAGTTADEGTRIGFQMKMGSSKLNVLQENVTKNAANSDYSVTTLQYGMDMGKNMFGVSYTMTGRDGTAADSTQTTIGVHHKLSKKTKVAVAYTTISNDENSTTLGRIGATSNHNSGLGSWSAAGAGEDPSQMGVMITHSF